MNDLPKRLETPVAFAIFKRPAETAKAFAEIARVKPRQLFVIADGPRSHVPGEAAKCAATRKVIEGVDWDCEVLTNYAETNLGSRLRISSGLNWVFDNVEEAIVLEDDCVPDSSFFFFCEELLRRYKDDERVSYISGDNFQFDRPRSSYSYFFSLYGCSWGWASWRRVWRQVDVEMKNWPAIKESGLLQELLGDRLAAQDYTECLEDAYERRIDAWDYQFALACWLHKRLSVVPQVNLVTNIGYSADSTHTMTIDRKANLPAKAMPFPLNHPPRIESDPVEDRYTHSVLFGPRWRRAIHHGKRNLAALIGYSERGSGSRAGSLL